MRKPAASIQEDRQWRANFETRPEEPEALDDCRDDFKVADAAPDALEEQ